MSDTRAEGLVMGQAEKHEGFSKLMALRKITTFPSSKSISYVVQFDPNRSYKSSETMKNDRIKHYRPSFGPRDRFPAHGPRSPRMRLAGSRRRRRCGSLSTQSAPPR